MYFAKSEYRREQAQGSLERMRFLLSVWLFNRRPSPYTEVCSVLLSRDMHRVDPVKFRLLHVSVKPPSPQVKALCDSGTIHCPPPWTPFGRRRINNAGIRMIAWDWIGYLCLCSRNGHLPMPHHRSGSMSASHLSPPWSMPQSDPPEETIYMHVMASVHAIITDSSPDSQKATLAAPSASL